VLRRIPSAVAALFSSPLFSLTVAAIFFPRVRNIFSCRAVSDRRKGDTIARGKPGKGRRSRVEPRKQALSPLWKPCWASSVASGMELLHLHQFGRAPTRAPHGALPNRPFVSIVFRLLSSLVDGGACSRVGRAAGPRTFTHTASS
jgi:phage gpG-like protein